MLAPDRSNAERIFLVDRCTPMQTRSSKYIWMRSSSTIERSQSLNTCRYSGTNVFKCTRRAAVSSTHTGSETVEIVGRAVG